MAELSLHQLTKAYGKTEVLHGINLGVADGEFVVFVGPSGCGKSTTLRMIAGLEEVTSGEIHIGGTVVNNLEPKERNIAMVFQNYAIYPHMTVRKNIGFGLRSSGLPKADKEARIDEVAALLGMTDLLARKPSQLSGGQRQRVAIGRAMVRDPSVFLFDEPLSNLDAQLRTQMRLEIKKLHQRVGTTIIFVTHDQVEAMTMADRIVIMDGGHIQQVGTPEEVYRRPANAFVAGFIGAPSMNMLAAEAGPDGVRTNAGGSIAMPLGADFGKRAVTLGVRPDDLHLTDGEGLVAGTVAVCEPLGPETLVHIDTAGGEVVAKADGRHPPKVGDTVRLIAAQEDLHLFDADSGVALSWGPRT
ncbi:sn-glycerol-3-phosphate ABC transporter ATP-binding protein UgpC [Marinovum sp. 2_MG-2023]|uniref:ABC transporter ATP-binding protein n=1 Tax=unclassified Marinovum TaxID=2647166 RepID=UPI0026E180AF|nr:MULTISPECIES: sn-glycerol-3-phosphate ABC transporter ATP-binding protein UgpC [unclassified Marinovum]MDO6730926.1 sn-glycerol-3-phosphate ABC transporter ATP-binding protein UgpC [Marinovum sp. 2_MG-2023]MDO6780153.1 sn-glycerol-3-phosphate ABC transporter ATP-binding protein UgpC [Marinovum sp. 1_MG-2023]